MLAATAYHVALPVSVLILLQGHRLFERGCPDGLWYRARNDIVLSGGAAPASDKASQETGQPVVQQHHDETGDEPHRAIEEGENDDGADPEHEIEQTGFRIRLSR